MATRHRLSYPLECRTCRTSGIALVSENAGPPFKTDPTREYTITGGFRLRTGAIPGLGLQIECSGCETLAG